MPRIVGVDIPNDKRVVIALTYVHGIGPHLSVEILKQAGIDENARAKDLTEDEISRIATIIVVPLTTNTRLAAMPGNVLLSSRKTGLPKDSVANVSQVTAIDRALLTERVGRIAPPQLKLIFGGIDILFDR